MKLVKTASGKEQLKISKFEWKAIGKQAGWDKEAVGEDAGNNAANAEAIKVQDFSMRLRNALKTGVKEAGIPGVTYQKAAALIGSFLVQLESLSIPISQVKQQITTLAEEVAQPVPQATQATQQVAPQQATQQATPQQATQQVAPQQATQQAVPASGVVTR